jgi:hypothetical protein
VTAVKGPKGPLTVVSLTAENVKRLRAVRIVPEGSSVVLSGRNAQGKTSVMDCIELALAGAPALKRTKRPIRDGESKASIVLDLGDIVVTRTWRDDDTSALKVESRDGARYSSPQALLDGLIGKLAFDPLAFAQQSPKDQRATLLGMVDLTDPDGQSIDLDDMRERRRAWFDERTVIGRDVTRLAGALAELPPVPDGTPTEPVSLTELGQEHRAALEADRAKTDALQAVNREQMRWGDLDAEVKRLEREVLLAVAARDRQEDAHTQAVNFYEALPAAPDPTPILERMFQAEETNRAVAAAARRREVAAQLDARKAEQVERTEWIAALDETVGVALAKAPLPLAGLTIEQDAVAYQGIPLAQASSAEQLRVSVAVAMALNPTLRVIRISDGSLLDSENMALIDSMAADRGFQVWIERVDESGQVGILIEDGMVKA